MEIQVHRASRYIIGEKEVSKPKLRGCCSGIFGRLYLYIKFAFQDYCRRKCLFCIGVLTIVICFVTAMVSQSVISKTPIIFYHEVVKISGDRDIVISAQYNKYIGGSSFFLNFT